MMCSTMDFDKYMELYIDHPSSKEDSSIDPDIDPCFPFLINSSLSLVLIITAQFSIPVVLSFQECHVNGINKYIAF